MFQKYKKFNFILLPLYLFLGLAMTLGILLTFDEEMYFEPVFYLILQFWGIIGIVNLVYFIMKRKEVGNGKAFLQMFFLIPVPFVILALLMRVVMPILIKLQ
ncbi:hypothetical protein CIB95_09320 [Lottiidibacillus patelloidae]|uniref:Uncharacterized protein n=1 Tax=Lottiidibacillus patelloidae TaxID=2670334 RepID=A0A263BTB6_9BACI|nr:hypothetical protein [Lottiidibacillus patelloidae]OZM56960.1 hypothetical protein CIB95_09320 [Lottiidibacillus patelloidae]